MGLKKRLILSNFAIVAVPLAVTFLASFIFIFVFGRINNVDIGYKSINKFTQIQYEFFKADGHVLRSTPEMLLEKEFQQYIAKRFEDIGADIVIIKGQERVFETIPVGMIELEKCLGEASDNPFKNTIKVRNITYMSKVIDIDFKGGQKGNVVLFVPVGNEWFTTEKLFLFSAIVFIISFLLTNIATISLFTNKIIKPLENLQTAAVNISNGNLDFMVTDSGDAPIKDLCRSFEKMRLKLVEALHKQQKYDDSRNMLISSISHDLKTPITSIKGYVEGVLDGVANTPQKAEEYLNTIYSKAIHMDRMIDDLLLHSKFDINGIPFNFEKTDIVSYFEDCVSEVEIELKKFGISINLHGKELLDNRYIMLDRDRIRRVIINIIDNSRKYMGKEKGEISIFLRKASTNILVEIRDDGVGMPKEELPYIFDRFYRADVARNTMKGSGLGLAIAKQIVEAHGGRIWAISHGGGGMSIIMSFAKSGD